MRKDLIHPPSVTSHRSDIPIRGDKKSDHSKRMETAPNHNPVGSASSSTDVPKAPRRIIRRRGTGKAPSAASAEYQIDPILLEKVLQSSSLPKAYSFEIIKTVQRCVALNVNHIGLQMPEGLLLYATVIGDVLKQLTPCLDEVSVFTDVTYGACCVEDLTAQQLGCQLLVHYGHSCLVPMPHTQVPVLYVFVEVQFDVSHMVQCLLATLGDVERPPLALLGTVQFRHALAGAKDRLVDAGFTVAIPQAKPLSPGEVLGCTSPAVVSDSVVLFVADGRFHLESTLIANPDVAKCYRYDPYSQTLSQEEYDHPQMHSLRQNAIAQATSSQSFGIILGTLGRQGNPAIVGRVEAALRKHGKDSFVVLLSEILPSKLQLMPVDAWVQVACPRLSVDWGHYLCQATPVLSPYELFVTLGEADYQSSYPMDYYSASGGEWSNYHGDNKERKWLQ